MVQFSAFMFYFVHLYNIAQTMTSPGVIVYQYFERGYWKDLTSNTDFHGKQFTTIRCKDTGMLLLYKEALYTQKSVPTKNIKYACITRPQLDPDGTMTCDVRKLIHFPLDIEDNLAYTLIYRRFKPICLTESPDYPEISAYCEGNDKLDVINSEICRLNNYFSL